MKKKTHRDCENPCPGSGGEKPKCGITGKPFTSWDGDCEVEKDSESKRSEESKKD